MSRLIYLRYMVSFVDLAAEINSYDTLQRLHSRSSNFQQSSRTECEENLAWWYSSECRKLEQQHRRGRVTLLSLDSRKLLGWASPRRYDVAICSLNFYLTLSFFFPLNPRKQHSLKVLFQVFVKPLVAAAPGWFFVLTFCCDQGCNGVRIQVRCMVQIFWRLR